MIGVSLFASIIIASATAIAAERRIAQTAAGEVFDADDAPEAPVAIVPGAGIGDDGALSSVLEDRLIAAVRLYRSGRAKKLLLSGDHGRARYDEPGAMARFVERCGVAPADVFLDHAGFDTHATFARARRVFGVRRALVVTQEFHLPRALYLARRLGVDAIGVRADRRRYQRRAWYRAREIAAGVKAVIAVEVLDARPRFLGPPIAIDGDGRVTRDR